MDAHTLFEIFWTGEKKHPPYSHSNAWKIKDHF